MSKQIYVRTDKNGTKIYHDYTCPRCGGAGGGDQWAYTGWTCYECGGTGQRSTPQIIKEYTPEYRAKLDAQRAKRAEKQRLERVKEFRDNLPKLIEEKGFNADGKAYVAVGNTYDIKEQLKDAGAKWKPVLNSWIFTEAPSQFSTVELTAEECLDFHEESGVVDWKSLNYSELIQSKLPKEEKTISNYVGNVGDKVELEVTLEKVRSWDVPSYAGYGMTTKVLYVFRDVFGNILVWATTGFGVNAEEVQAGDKAILKGTVSAHTEYDGEKQTTLKRCKVLAS